MSLELTGVSVAYRSTASSPPFKAVERVSISVPVGSFASLIGPSGCGKSSLLNVVAGLVEATEGEVIWGGNRVRGPGSDRAMVFQSAALLPWRTLLRNVVFGAELRHQASARELESRAREFIKLVGLEGKEHLYPHQLSGGMQQRANLARALMVSPQILLLDEPFGALDAYTRDLMQEELERISASINATTLLVTHQIAEAVYLSDTVFVMSGSPGRLMETVLIDETRPRGFDWRETSAATEYERRIAHRLREAWSGV